MPPEKEGTENYAVHYIKIIAIRKITESGSLTSPYNRNIDLRSQGRNFSVDFIEHDRLPQMLFASQRCQLRRSNIRSNMCPRCLRCTIKFMSQSHAI